MCRRRALTCPVGREMSETHLVCTWWWWWCLGAAAFGVGGSFSGATVENPPLLGIPTPLGKKRGTAHAWPPATAAGKPRAIPSEQDTLLPHTVLPPETLRAVGPGQR